MPETPLTPAGEPANTDPAPGPGGSDKAHRTLPKLLLEVSMIAAGVFLGLAGEQWRQGAEHREDARVTLERLRAEISSNRSETARVKDYHARIHAPLKTYLTGDVAQRKAMSLKIEGVQPVPFDRTAWDLALSTGSLAYIDRELAFSLSRVYNVQATIAGLANGLTQAMYLRPPAESRDGFLASFGVFLDDAVILEPELLKLYDEILPRLDRALGGR